MRDKRVEKHVERLRQLDAKRKPWEARWREIADHLAPRLGRFAEDRAGGPRGQSKIVESRPQYYLRNLASLMFQGLTPPTRPWFRLGLEDEDLAEYGPARVWLDRVEKAMQQAFRRSNFHASAYGVYDELIAFGTACHYLEADHEQFIRCSVLTAGRYWAAADASGRIDTIYRLCPMTARQMASAWGMERCSRAVRLAAVDAPDAVFDVAQAVTPRSDWDNRRKDAAGKPWASVYFEPGGEGVLLGEGGYEEFPFQTPRWHAASGEVYGWGPGLEALPDVKMLMDVSKSLIMAVHKVVDPPMLLPAHLRERLNLLPGAANYYQGPNPEGVRPLYQIDPDLSAGQALKEDVLGAVREGFFNDLLALFALDRAGVTATEIAERHEEKLLLLGPVVERQETEFLNPLIRRTFNLMGRAGLLPPLPPGVGAPAMKVEYVSLLSQAQKLVGTRAVQSLVSFVAGLKELAPEAADKLDLDRAVDEYARMTGVPGRIVRPDAQVAAIRGMRAGMGLVSGAVKGLKG